MINRYIKWEELNYTWEKLDITWDEIFLIEEVKDIVIKKNGGISSDYIKSNPWDISKKEIEYKLGKEKANKFIKLICKINGVKYEEKIEIKDIKIKANSPNKVKSDSKLGIKLNLENNI